MKSVFGIIIYHNELALRLVECDVSDGETFVRDARVRLEDDGQSLARARQLGRCFLAAKSKKNDLIERKQIKD